MGYYIHYGEKMKRKDFAVKRREKRTRIALCAIIVLLLISFGGIVAFCSNLLLPGDPVTTKSAGKVFVEDIESGAGFKDAFFDFCKVIVSDEIF